LGVTDQFCGKEAPDVVHIDKALNAYRRVAAELEAALGGRPRFSA
jgi:hypothetical protein